VAGNESKKRERERDREGNGERSEIGSDEEQEEWEEARCGGNPGGTGVLAAMSVNYVPVHRGEPVMT